MINFAERAHNHNYKLDPIIRSLMDTDMYKILMLNYINQWHKNTPVSFYLINRTKSVPLAKEINIEELKEQLDYVKTLKFTNQELIWLRGNTFFGQDSIFTAEFINWLKEFKLSEYDLKVENDQIILTFSGTWAQVTMWEIYALAIINEMRSRQAMRQMTKFELDILYSQAKTKLWEKITKLKTNTDIRVADMGTRRRHSFLWQEWCIEAMASELGTSFTGTSNISLAMKLGLEAIGTNAHELPMVMATKANNNEELKNSQYQVLQEWQKTYQGSLLIALPDTYGTTQFLENAPEWLKDWTGFRVDSKDPVTAGYELINWWKENNVDPTTKRILFSDGLDVNQILMLQEEFFGKTQVGFGWGTNLTNDFKNCHPRNLHTLDAISLVCKVKEGNNRPAVKLSDNYLKATGPQETIEQYRNVFGTKGVENIPVVV